MKLFNFGKKDVKQTETVINNNGSDMVNSVMEFGLQTSLPTIKESKNKDWVDYGDDNDYPSYLEDLYSNSPTHQAIIDTKSLLIAGNGYEINKDKLSVEQQMDLMKILEFTDGTNDIETVISMVAKDNELYGAFCLEVIWSLDFSNITKITRISPKHIRCGKYDDGVIEEYFYSRDWSNRREEIKPIAAFNLNDDKHHRQLIYVGTQKVSNEYYGEPSYLASVNWIDLESQTGLYYRSLIENGFNPSVVVKFYRKPSSQEERDEVVRGLKSSFGGVKNSGKAVVMFSDGKELAPDIDPIQVSNVDKQFTVIADQIVTKILTGGRVTTPELFGISVPGKLGTGDFLTQVETFIKFVITPPQKVIERTFDKLFKINGLNVDFKIKPLELGLNDNPITETNVINNNPTDIEAQAKASLKGSVGGVQGILQIQASVADGTTDYQSALSILDLIYGIGEVDARKILGNPTDNTQIK